MRKYKKARMIVFWTESVQFVSSDMYAISRAGLILAAFSQTGHKRDQIYTGDFVVFIKYVHTEEANLSFHFFLNNSISRKAIGG